MLRQPLTDFHCDTALDSAMMRLSHLNSVDVTMLANQR